MLVIVAIVLVAQALAQQDTLHYGDVQSVVANPYTEGTNPAFPDQKGYVAGTNVYEDIGKYQRIDLYNSHYVIGAVVYFGLKEIDTTGVADTITIVLRDMASQSTSGIFGPADTILASTTVTLD